MTALPQVPAVQPAPSTEPTPKQPMQMDAFRSAMSTAGAVLNAGPDAIGKTLLSGIEKFNANDAQFRNTVAQASAPEASPTPTATDGTPPVDPSSPGAPHGLTTAQALQKADALQRESMGVMMQTYSFALDATLVSNAATTFTSSVNTLIKTQ